MQEFVVLVDENDQVIGRMGKLEAHEKGLLHRAFSVLIFNSNNELLLQKRAYSKYHSGGLWTNTTCSHPRVGETVLLAGARRLNEEMGITCELKQAFSFIYKAELDQGLTEYELDHVMIGFSDKAPCMNLEEVNAFKWMSLNDLKNDMTHHPQLYTVWFKILINQHLETIQQHLNYESL
jgi:isopentenyl-diphosphate delta-isomerase